MSTGRRRWWRIVGVCVVALAGTAAFVPRVRIAVRRLVGQAASVEDRVAEHAPRVRAILERELSAVSVPYPPRRFALVAIKSEGRLHLYVGTETGYRHVRSYPILAASGTLGPKLREGDRQVPEGFYRIESLNPNSRFHLSLRLDYPNAEDRAQAAKDGRSDPGGDIMIHGGSASIGCLAIGDPAIEELFVLAADAGIASAEVLIVPVDLRTEPPPASAIADRAWVSELYERLGVALRAFPPPPGG